MYIVLCTSYLNIGEAWDLRPKWREHSARDPSPKKKRERERSRARDTLLSTSRPQETTIIVSCTYLYLYMYTYITVLENYERWRTLNFQPFLYYV